MARRGVELKVLRGILNLVRTNKGSYTTVHVKKVQRYGKVRDVPSTLVGKCLAELKVKGILKPRTIGHRRVYVVNVQQLVKELKSIRQRASIGK